MRAGIYPEGQGTGVKCLEGTFVIFLLIRCRLRFLMATTVSGRGRKRRPATSQTSNGRSKAGDPALQSSSRDGFKSPRKEYVEIMSADKIRTPRINSSQSSEKYFWVIKALLFMIQVVVSDPNISLSFTCNL